MFMPSSILVDLWCPCSFYFAFIWGENYLRFLATVSSFPQQSYLLPLSPSLISFSLLVTSSLRSLLHPSVPLSPSHLSFCASTPVVSRFFSSDPFPIFFFHFIWNLQTGLMFCHCNLFQWQYSWWTYRYSFLLLQSWWGEIPSNNFK